jgi:hypothetical protein
MSEFDPRPLLARDHAVLSEIAEMLPRIQSQDLRKKLEDAIEVCQRSVNLRCSYATLRFMK